jgi:hypothetical protein
VHRVLDRLDGEYALVGADVDRGVLRDRDRAEHQGLMPTEDFGDQQAVLLASIRNGNGTGSMTGS